MNSKHNIAQKVYNELLQRVGEANPRPRIEPVARLATYLGEPQQVYPVIQVAGTNGKTSTARTIEILLRHHGLKTGLFTSPHLLSFTERIKIDGEDIDEETLVEAWDEMQPALQVLDSELISEGQSAITFFEALAVLGFLVFSNVAVDVAVIEVGMGGEWDATNIANAEVAVITPIDLDHTHILGDSIAAIAKTKAKIIKVASTAVSAVQSTEAAMEISRQAENTSAKLLLAGRDFGANNIRPAVGGQIFDSVSLSGERYEDLMLPLFGAHQSDNAALAIAAAEAFLGQGNKIDLNLVHAAFADLQSPGRLQVLSRDPLVIVDAAHNPHGAQMLADGLATHFAYDELLLVLGILADKDSAGVAKNLLPLATRVIVTTPDSDRAKASERLLSEVQAVNSNITVADSLSATDAFQIATEWGQAKSKRLVLIAGSVVLAGQAIAHFSKKD